MDSAAAIATYELVKGKVNVAFVAQGHKTTLTVGCVNCAHHACPPTLHSTATLTGNASVARYLARAAQPSLLGLNPRDIAEVLLLDVHSSVVVAFTQVSQWIEIANATQAKTVASLHARLNDHLAARTYLLGTALTLADLFIFFALQCLQMHMMLTFA